MHMHIIRMHGPSQLNQDYKTETFWRGIARHLYSLIPMDAYFGPFDLPGGKGILSKKDTDEIKEQTGCKASVRERHQWDGRKLSITGPPERLKEARELAMGKI